MGNSVAQEVCESGLVIACHCGRRRRRQKTALLSRNFWCQWQRPSCCTLFRLRAVVLRRPPWAMPEARRELRLQKEALQRAMLRSEAQAKAGLQEARRALSGAMEARMAGNLSPRRGVCGARLPLLLQARALLALAALEMERRC